MLAELVEGGGSFGAMLHAGHGSSGNAMQIEITCSNRRKTQATRQRSETRTLSPTSATRATSAGRWMR